MRIIWFIHFCWTLLTISVNALVYLRCWIPLCFVNEVCDLFVLWSGFLNSIVLENEFQVHQCPYFSKMCNSVVLYRVVLDSILYWNGIYIRSFQWTKRLRFNSALGGYWFAYRQNTLSLSVFCSFIIILLVELSISVAFSTFTSLICDCRSSYRNHYYHSHQVINLSYYNESADHVLLALCFCA